MKTTVKYVVLKSKDYQLGTALFEEELDASNTYFDEITIKDLKIYNDGSNMTISSPSLQFKINEQLAI